MPPEDQTQFSNDDIGQILNGPTEADMQQRLQALDEAQTTWEKVRYLEVAKMPCPECSGSGSVSSGSLGDICLGCGGSRVVDQPGVEDFAPPPFATMRAQLAGYANALADRDVPKMLPAGFDREGKVVGERPNPGKRNLVLPAAAELPSLADIQKLNQDGVARAKALKAAPGVVDQRMLTAPKPKADDGSDDGRLADFSDAELDKMEEDADDADDNRAGRRVSREAPVSKRKK